MRLVADRLTREAILEAALSLLDTEGHHAVTLRGVARHLGVTPPALYRYFGTSAELLEAVGFVVVSTVEQEVDDLTTSTSPGVARLLSRAALLMSAVLPSSLAGVLSQRQIELLRRDIEDAQTLGELRSDMPTERIVALIRMIIAGFRSTHSTGEGEAPIPLVVLGAFLAPYLRRGSMAEGRRI